MQLASRRSRNWGSWIVPLSTALNVIVSPDRRLIRAPLALSTSWRVGNLGWSELGAWIWEGFGYMDVCVRLTVR